jgi:hypothetical protein
LTTGLARQRFETEMTLFAMGMTVDTLQNQIERIDKRFDTVREDTLFL